MYRSRNKRIRKRAQPADNCGACGQEFSAVELSKVKLASIGWELKLCSNCLGQDTLSNYRDAAKGVQHNDSTLQEYRAAASMLNRRNGLEKMTIPEEPLELKEACYELEKDLQRQGLSVESVGTGYGLVDREDGPEDAKWMLFVYAKEPAQVDVRDFSGFPVKVYPVLSAL